MWFSIMPSSASRSPRWMASTTPQASALHASPLSPAARRKQLEGIWKDGGGPNTRTSNSSSTQLFASTRIRQEDGILYRTGPDGVMQPHGPAELPWWPQPLSYVIISVFSAAMVLVALTVSLRLLIKASSW